MSQGTDRVDVSERPEALLCGGRRQPRIPGIESSHSIEQGAIKQLLVNATHLARMSAPLLREFGHRIGAESEGPSNATQVSLIVRNNVGSPQGMQLDAVF